jgi:hypothetical protein
MGERLQKTGMRMEELQEVVSLAIGTRLEL